MMSGEHFETVLLKLMSHSRLGPVHCYMYAANALFDCADAVENESMNGISGDMKDQRMLMADLIRKIADLVDDLARDSACDGEVVIEKWNEKIDKLSELISKGKITTQHKDV